MLSQFEREEFVRYFNKVASQVHNVHVRAGQNPAAFPVVEQEAAHHITHTMSIACALGYNIGLAVLAQLDKIEKE